MDWDGNQWVTRFLLVSNPGPSDSQPDAITLVILFWDGMVINGLVVWKNMFKQKPGSHTWP